MGATLVQVRVDEQSEAKSLREDTRRRSYQSLAFFLTSVLNVPVPPEVAETLQELGLRRLVMLLVGSLLWCKIHAVKMPKDPAQMDAVRWLFPEAKDL